MWPKIIQVNAKDVYAIGGNNLKCETQDNWNFIVQKTNIQIDVRSNKVTRRADMIKPRQAQGICAINNHIYCVCGISSDEAYNHIERYDILTDKWELLEEKYPKYAFAISCIPIKRRFIYTFG